MFSIHVPSVFRRFMRCRLFPLPRRSNSRVEFKAAVFACFRSSTRNLASCTPNNDGMEDKAGAPCEEDLTTLHPLLQDPLPAPELRLETFDAPLSELSDLCGVPSIDPSHPHLSIFAGFLKEIRDREAHACSASEPIGAPFQVPISLTDLKTQPTPVEPSADYLHLSQYTNGQVYRVLKPKGP